jgi:hypothetical protein
VTRSIEEGGGKGTRDYDYRIISFLLENLLIGPYYQGEKKK